MDLKEIWNSLEASDFGGGEKAERLQEIRQHSRHPMAQLRLRLKQKLWWSLGLTLLFIGSLGALLVFAPATALHLKVPLIGAAILILGANWSAWPLYKAYQDLKGTPDVTSNILECLRHHRDTGKMIYRLESRVAYVLAAPSPALGALISMMGEGKTFEEVLYSNDIWVILIAALVTAPLVVWLTNWMNRIAFGKELGAIEKLIADLEALEEEDDTGSDVSL